MSSASSELAESKNADSAQETSEEETETSPCSSPRAVRGTSPVYYVIKEELSADSSNASIPDDSAVRLDSKKLICVRKDLFPKVRLPKLDTEYNNRKKLRSCNGIDDYTNGYPSPEQKRRKSSKKHSKRSSGKNMSTLLAYDVDDSSTESFDSMDNVALIPSKLPPTGGKPFSHQMSQLARRRHHVQTLPIVPSGGKPRSMMGITSSKNKKSNKKNAPTYQSQISVDTNTIKIRIKKSNSHTSHTTHSTTEMSTKSIADIGLRPAKATKRKKAKSPTTESSSGEEYNPSKGDVPSSLFTATASKPRPPRRPPAPRAHRERPSKALPAQPNNQLAHSGQDTTQKNCPTAKTSRSQAPTSSARQSQWATNLPLDILTDIFHHVVTSHGAIPSLIRLGTVCKLWRAASLHPNLWRWAELAPHTKEIWKTDYKLAWLLEHRLAKCQQLNLSNWKVSNLTWLCACIVAYSPLLRELNLTGWKRLSAENLKDIVDGLHHLRRIDLSFNSDTGSSGTCLSTASLTYLTQTMTDRLTHLSLANNKFAGLTQVLVSIATNCPSLELLDISGVLAQSHPASIPLEKLQKGCTKLRVLRAANSQLVLSSATTIEQMESPGFPCLEELSVACPNSDYKFIDDDALGRLLKSSTALRLLDVRGCIRISDSGLVRVPAWDLQHLFLSGCSVTRQTNSCLELICEKWAHSLVEVDLQWATATRPLDSAVEVLSDKGNESRLKTVNLCGSAVSLEPVKKILLKCPKLESINLSSCRALPRGMKRLYSGKELRDLKDSLDPVKIKEKEEAERLKQSRKKPKEEKPEVEAKAKEPEEKEGIRPDDKESEAATKDGDEPIKEVKHELMKSPRVVLEKVIPNIENTETNSPMSVGEAPKSNQSSVAPEASPRLTPKSRVDHYSPVDSSLQTKPAGPGPWHLGQFSPMTKPDSQAATQASPEAIKQNWNLGQFNPVKRSPDTPHKTWNVDPYRQEGPSPYSAQPSPYSAQPSPAQPSPYSAQPSPYSPYSAQPSPDTSQTVNKQEPPKSSWNLGQFSPMAKQVSQYSSQPSPDTGNSSKEKIGAWNLGQFSPMARQDSQYPAQQSPYSPRPSPETSKSDKTRKMRPDCSVASQPSPDTGQHQLAARASRSWPHGQFSPMAAPATMPSPDTSSGKVWPFAQNSEPVKPPNQLWNAAPYGVPGKSVVPPNQWNYGPASYDVLADLQQHLDTGQPVPESTDSWNLGQFQAGSSVDVHPGFPSVNSQCAWSDNSGFANDPLIPTTVQGLRAKSDKDRTGYGLMDAVNPVTTSCAVSQMPNMLQAPMEPLNGPSRID